MEAGEDGLTRVTRFFACRLELNAVAGLLWILWCVLGGVPVLPRHFSPFVFSFERTRPVPSLRPVLASFTSLLMRQDRGSEATDAVFSLQAEKPFHTGARTGRN